MTRLACLAIMAMAGITTANAGGMLTNTNQSIAFLRNPAREAAIGIDGVYSNPAGVAFMDLGWHFGVNWQCAVQTRTIETTNLYLDHTLNATEATAPTKRYRGHASAPCIPSLQAAYNTGKWSFQFNFAVAGGGGKCEFTKGIGTFESAVGQIATMLKPLGVMGYSSDSYMEGRQYYYGITLGAAYKVHKNLSVYAGVRGLIANASYIAQIKDIQVATSAGLQNLGTFLDQENAYFDGVISQTQAAYNQYASQVDAIKAAYAQMDPTSAQGQQYGQILTAIAAYPQAVAAKEQIAPLDGYRDGIDLHCDETGFGIAPLFGVDWKIGSVNLSAKYEFKTVMNLKNSSNLKAASIAATAQFVDGEKVREDSPALLAFGGQYSPAKNVRIDVGYHHFYDKQAKKFGDKNELLKGGTNEYLGGIEVDVTERLTLSTGGQITRYGLTDDYMSDVSFVTNSKSVGFGAKYKANQWVTIQAAYFKTFYDHYKTANGANDFTRTNDVIGVGCDIDF